MKKLVLLLFSMSLLAACSSPDDQLDNLKPGDNSISFIDGGISTRVTNNQFDDGDQIYVQAFNGNELYDDAYYSYLDSEFISKDPFILANNVSLSYWAIYPFYATTSSIVELSQEQYIKNNFTESDILVAKVNATSETNPLLRFKHVMSSIILNVKVVSNGEEVTGSDVEVAFSLKNTAEINVENDEYTATGDNATITPYASVGNGSSSNHNFSVVAPPQVVAANNVIASVTVNDIDQFYFTHATDLTLMSGKRYTYTMTVDVVTKDVTIEFGGTIDDWEDVSKGGLTLADFSADNYPTDTDEWVITDKAVESGSDFNGLLEAINSLAMSGRKISLSFPNINEIRSSAFYNYRLDLSALTSITADSATAIGSSAFYSCVSLETVSFPEVITCGAYAFKDCFELTSVSLPKAESFGYQAFYQCFNMESISLPAATTFESRTFFLCLALTNVDLPQVEIFDWSNLVCANSIEVVTTKYKTYKAEDGVFYNDDKSTIYKYAGATEARTFTAPSSVEVINDYAFDDCENLVSITIPNATEIGMQAISYCDMLQSVSLPNATYIGELCFIENQVLDEVYIPRVDSLDWGCFANSNKIAEITTKNKTYQAENGVFYNEDKSTIYKYVGTEEQTEFIAPSSVTTIEKFAFSYAYFLSFVSLPEVTTIGDRAFFGCESLTSISSPELTSVEELTFFKCYSLASISFPKATSIGEKTFYHCGDLSEVHLPKVTSIENSAFAYCESLKNLEIATEATLTYADPVIFNYYCHTDEINLTIGRYNDNIDTDANTWLGYPFASITLVDYPL